MQSRAGMLSSRSQINWTLIKELKELHFFYGNRYGISQRNTSMTARYDDDYGREPGDER